MKLMKIEFEGTDAAGKTTGLKYFIEKAKAKSLNVVETREVGNPHLESCVKMRQFVLDPANKLSGEAMELIFSAMRIESDIWLKSLPDTVDMVISDRGYFSHTAYGLHNTSEFFTKALFEDLMAKITALPDVVIYFKVGTDIAKQRMIGRGQAMDVIELKGTGYQEKVRDAFEMYFKKYSNIKVITIDANQNIEGVRAQLDAALDSILK